MILAFYFVRQHLTCIHVFFDSGDCTDVHTAWCVSSKQSKTEHGTCSYSVFFCSIAASSWLILLTSWLCLSDIIDSSQRAASILSRLPFTLFTAASCRLTIACTYMYELQLTKNTKINRVSQQHVPTMN